VNEVLGRIMSFWRELALVGALQLFVLPGCTDATSRASTAETPRLVVLTDLDERPDVVEVSLIASVAEKRYLEAGTAQVWAYSDGGKSGARPSVPGPLLEAKQGDQVIVHFRNELPEGTTIHWHGIRVFNASDGSTATQTEVAPGDEYTYEFVARDEGTFWYHPHVRGDAQVELGLHGMVVIRGGRSIEVDAERMLVLDDVKLNASGTLSDSTTSLDIMLGRQGNFIVANGAIGSTLSVASGSRERWRIVNTANGRYFNLRLPGHSFRVIGWDGGLLAEPYSTDTLLIVPGERYDVLVELQARVGSQVALETIYYDRGHDIPDVGPEPVLALDFRRNAPRDPAPLPETWGAPVTLTPPSDAPEQRFVLNEHEIDDGADVRFTINDAAFPDVPPVEGREGDVVVWTFDNESEMDHPFHLHGMFFRVLDVDGAPPEHTGWKDTVNVPKKSTLRFAVEYGEPGTWMYHCHVLEHQERGMMGELVLSAR
jgi:FtsP/CotA-like multicopper oxidase with cupredoxin domain